MKQRDVFHEHGEIAARSDVRKPGGVLGRQGMWRLRSTCSMMRWQRKIKDVGFSQSLTFLHRKRPLRAELVPPAPAILFVTGIEWRITMASSATKISLTNNRTMR